VWSTDIGPGEERWEVCVRTLFFNISFHGYCKGGSIILCSSLLLVHSFYVVGSLSLSLLFSIACILYRVRIIHTHGLYLYLPAYLSPSSPRFSPYVYVPIPVSLSLSLTLSRSLSLSLPLSLSRARACLSLSRVCLCRFLRPNGHRIVIAA
jgi:hypothetical protein